jgi:hypothetical protein
MFHIAIGLSSAAFIAAIATFAARMGRRNNCPDFSVWWKSEGWPIFVGVWIVFSICFFVVK